jgi:hypothetical protein
MAASNINYNASCYFRTRYIMITLERPTQARLKRITLHALRFSFGRDDAFRSIPVLKIVHPLR